MIYACEIPSRRKGFKAAAEISWIVSCRRTFMGLQHWSGRGGSKGGISLLAKRGAKATF